MSYNRSNLTKILKTSLSGNSKTFMLCTLRPGAKHIEETLKTLWFANQCKQIKITATVNESNTEKLLNWI